MSNPRKTGYLKIVPMKKFYTAFFVSIKFSQTYSQHIQLGVFGAQLGIDTDGHSNFTKLGMLGSRNIGARLYSVTRGKDVTHNNTASYYIPQFQINRNISFVQRMGVPVYSPINNYRNYC